MVSLGTQRSPEGLSPAPPPTMDPASSYNQPDVFVLLIASWEAVSEGPCLQSQETPSYPHLRYNHGPFTRHSSCTSVRPCPKSSRAGARILGAVSTPRSEAGF